MYSMVVMVALGGSVDLPDLGRHRRGHGCCGGGYSGCSGGYGGCYGGGGYGGCCGGGYAYGGYGGCHGGGYTYGGYGGGCYGSYASAPSYGGGYASAPAYGGYASYPGMTYGQQPYTSGYYTPGMSGSGILPTWGGDTTQQGILPASSDVTATDRMRSGTEANAATMIVRLPADAKLMIDDEPTRAQSDERRFVTPALQPGKTYHYTLKAELNRGGETLKTSRDIDVRAGETSRVTLEFPGVNPANR